MDRIRWAVMGAGGIARRRTIPEGILAADNAELVAVYAPNSGLDVARQFGVAAAESEESLFDFDFDAVYVASPVDCHRRQVELAAAAGRSVLCEKPLALNVEDAEKMAAACASEGVTLGVGLMMRFHPFHRQAAELVQSGELGVPVYARAQLSCWYPPDPNAWRQDPARSGGGSLPDLASHCIDLLEMILGQRVKSVVCRKANLVHDYRVEDTAVVMLEFTNGTLATVDCLFNVPDAAVPNRLEIYGSLGSLLAEGTIGQGQAGELQWRRTKSESNYDSQQQRGGSDTTTNFSLAKGNLYLAQIEDFGRAIVEHREPIATGRQGVWIQRVLAACDRSATDSATITLGAELVR